MKKFYTNLDKSKIKLIVLNDSTIIDEKNHRVIHTIDWKLDCSSLILGLFYRITNRGYYDITGRAKGVAFCHPEDTFNPEKGTKIAKAIAESNAYHNASVILKKRLKALFKLNMKIEDQIIDFILRSHAIEVHNKEYHDSIISAD